MKLLLIVSIIAASYAEKLDRTYLPPANAGSAGGSPGSLTAPKTGSGAPISSRYPSGPSDTPSYTQNGRPGFGQTSDGSTVLKELGNQGQTNYGPGNTGFGGLRGQGSVKPQNGLNSGINRPTESGQGFGDTQGTNGIQQAYAQERPQATADRNAEILRYVNENDGETFTYSFETSNGISAEESGVATNGVKAQGGFSYTGDDGNGYSITYTADENGYQPQGEHLPTPHPIPEEILKSIEENEKAAAAGVQEGAYRPEEYENENNIQQYNQASNYNQGQNANSLQSQAPYNYANPSAPRQEQQTFPSQIGSGAINPFNQQPTRQESSPVSAFKPQQGTFNQYPQIPVTTNKDSPNQNGQLNNKLQSQTLDNKNLNGYNYNRPQYNQPINTNSVPQKSFESTLSGPTQTQGNFPSTFNTQTANNVRPSFSNGGSANSGSSPFSTLDKNGQVSSRPVGSLNQIGQNNNQFGQIGQNKEPFGYNYGKPQSAQNKATASPFAQGSFSGETQQQPIRGQNNLPSRPNFQTFGSQSSFNNGQSINSGSAPISSLNKNQQTYESRPIGTTNQVIQTNNRFPQRENNRGSDGYNYNNPQLNQFTPTTTAFDQTSFGNTRPNQQAQNQGSIPSKPNSFGNQRPSSAINGPGLESMPSSQYESNKNRQPFGSSRPNGILGQTEQPNAQFGQTEQNKDSNGYNYDVPKSNQNIFNQMRPYSTQNQGFFPSKSNSQGLNNQKLPITNGDSTNQGFPSSSFLNGNKPSVASRPIDSQNPSGQSLATTYIPQAQSSIPSRPNQDIPRGSTQSQSPLQYNRPASAIASQRPLFTPQGSQISNGNPNEGLVKSEQFSGPRQPPSFSAEEGYKY